MVKAVQFIEIYSFTKTKLGVLASDGERVRSESDTSSLDEECIAVLNEIPDELSHFVELCNNVK